MIELNICEIVAQKLGFKVKNVYDSLMLIDQGATVPFVARYRKEVTGGISDVDLNHVIDEYHSLENFISRRNTILKEIESQGKLTEDLKNQIMSADSLSTLEDLYRPYKPKKVTRGSKAKKAGLEPLAEIILNGEEFESVLSSFANVEAGYDTDKKILQGALDIIAENISDEPSFRAYIKKRMYKIGKIESTLADKTKDPKEKFANYYNKTFEIGKIKPHSFLALNRGRNEEILKVKYIFPDDEIADFIAFKTYKKENKNSEILKETIIDSYERLIKKSVTTDIDNELFSNAEQLSLKTFEKSLYEILMRPPYHANRILGFDPGFHHGCKLAVIDGTGKVLDTAVIYPTITEKAKLSSIKPFVDLLKKYHVEMIALGNGTATRESEDFINMALEQVPNCGYEVISEDGASIYSVTELAKKEFPNFDPNLRSAVSIARRLLDPLSELVKIEPSGLGVGQYQHDITKKLLEEHLENVVINAVNKVGVDVNTASISLLSYISGLSKTLAQNIVDYIKENGKITDRKEFLKIKGFGPKAFENAAGFLRVDGKNPFDKTSVHPESYELAANILKDLNVNYPKEKEKLENVSEKNLLELASKYKVDTIKIKDIIDDLSSPSRDPRGEAMVWKRDAKIRDIKDLVVGTNIEGVVRNITDFGVFVDLGVHVSGLIHISEISKDFVDKEHIHQYVKIGEKVLVKIIGVDIGKERISLSLKQVDKTL